MLRGLELTAGAPQKQAAKLGEAMLTYPILFPSFGKTNEMIFFLLLQANLCLDLVSLMQAQKVVLKGHIQFIVGHSKTQILYFRC